MDGLEMANINVIQDPNQMGEAIALTTEFKDFLNNIWRR